MGAGHRPARAAHGLWRANLPWAGLLLAAVFTAGGCATHYYNGQALEAKNRWEEASIEYHLAKIDDPEDPEVLAAVERANKVVARENFEHYRVYLARKQFHKAYLRLMDSSRQDPTFGETQQEMAKWMRVLVSGRVSLDFDVPQGLVSLADEMSLVVLINTPNPGEVIEAPIDIDSGVFFTENLLYDRPPELLALYSLNAIGIKLTYGRSNIKKFTSTETKRLVTFRTPVMDNLQGKLPLNSGGDQRRIAGHRQTLRGEGEGLATQAVVPQNNPRFSLRFRGPEIHVEAEGGQAVFAPRYLYLNLADRRQLVDFGHYQVRLQQDQKTWELKRLPLDAEDYFIEFSRNVALKPYFFYRDGVFRYRAASMQATGRLGEGEKRAAGS